MKKLIILLLCLIILSPSALASDVDVKLADALSTGDLQKAVPSGVKQSVRDMSPSDSNLGTGIDNLLSMITESFGTYIKQSLKTFVLIIVCALILGIAGASGNVEKPLMLVGVLSIAAICFGDVRSLFGLVTDTLRQIDDFSKMLLPPLTAATAAAGAPVGAAARSAATVLFSDILITIINRFLMPCTYAYLALITANAAIGNDTLKSFADFLKSALTGVLKLLLTLYFAYITIVGAITGTSDVMLEKSTKLAISGMVPVVGGIVSEATQTIVASAGLLRNSIGVFGLIAVLGMTIAPLIRLGVNYLLFKLAAAVSAPAAPAPVRKYIDALAQVYSIMFGMTFSAAVLLLIGIVSCMQAGMGG